jgi:hypothetical protein
MGDVKFTLDDYHRNIPDNLLIEDLVMVSKKINKSYVTVKAYDLNGKYHSATYVRRFGSWVNALEKAGLEKANPHNYRRKFTDEDLFKNLEEIWRKLGRQPRIEEIQKPLSQYSDGTYVSRFGSWRKALEKFVAYINNEEIASSEEAIKNLEIPPSTPHKVKRDKNQEIPQSALHKTKRGINWRLRFIVMRRDSFKCKNCGRSPATDPTIILNVDHIKPWSKGGETVLDNLQTLCSKCNVGKSNLV